MVKKRCVCGCLLKIAPESPEYGWCENKRCARVDLIVKIRDKDKPDEK